MIKKTLNIMYIAHERKLGGASLCLLTMAKEMKALGHNVYVIMPFKRCPIGKALQKEGITVKGIFFGWWMMPEYWGRFMSFAFRLLYYFEDIAVWRLCRQIKKNNIDIVHSNSSTIDVGCRAAVELGKPHIWHFREFGDKDYQLIFLKGREKSLKYITDSKSYNIFISSCLRDYYHDLPEEKYNFIIYDGISEEYVQENRRERKCDDKVRFLIAGNLQRNKRQDLVMRAVKLLKDRGIKEFEVYVAGGAASTKDSKEYAKELEKYRKVYQLTNVRMLGFVDKINEVRYNTDVEIVASTKEAFGRVTVEAMLSGNPVLASDSGANPELVLDGETGWLFREGDANSLADKLLEILENKKKIKIFGENAFNIAKSKFMSKKNTEDIEKMYYKILGERV